MITGKIKDVNIDQNGNIRVVTDYFDENGSVVHKDGVTRYSFSSSDSISDMMGLIEQDVNDHAQFLVTRRHVLDKNKSDMNKLKKLAIGKEFSATQGKLVTRKRILQVTEKKVLAEEPRTDL